MKKLGLFLILVLILLTVYFLYCSFMRGDYMPLWNENDDDWTSVFDENESLGEWEVEVL